MDSCLRAASSHRYALGSVKCTARRILIATQSISVTHRRLRAALRPTAVLHGLHRPSRQPLQFRLSKGYPNDAQYCQRGRGVGNRLSGGAFYCRHSMTSGTARTPSTAPQPAATRKQAVSRLPRSHEAAEPKLLQLDCGRDLNLWVDHALACVPEDVIPDPLAL